MGHFYHHSFLHQYYTLEIANEDDFVHMPKQSITETVPGNNLFRSIVFFLLIIIFMQILFMVCLF